MKSLNLMDSVISIADALAHLRLLGAFESYFAVLSKDHVRFNATTGYPLPTLAGGVAFRRSVHRLKLWITNVLRPKHLSNGLNDEFPLSELPPLDVLMMLHAYMLHPHRFYEDTLRVYPELALVKRFPLHQVVNYSTQFCFYML